MAIHREMTKFSGRMSREKAGIPSLKMRIGIHSGPVVVGTLGNDLRVEFKAVGDTVNLACRMEQLARPGTTYVTEGTFGLTEGLFRFESLGEKGIKGKEEVVNVYQVIAPSTRRTRFDVSAERGLTPFVGRDRELELLLDGFERAKTGRGQAFSIVGEAGLGKSRLLYEFRKAVTNENMIFLEGRSLSYSRGVAYHPVIDMLKSNFEIHEGEGDVEITRKIKEGLKVLEADEASTLPYLLELFSVEDIGIDRSNIGPETRKERIIDSLKRIVLRGSEIRPLIMAFEDLHWVDKSSEDAVKSILESIPGARVLLIFTYRPEFIHTWGGRSFHSQLNLIRLSNRESLAMVSHLLGTDYIDRNLEELILEKTEGIPFFIEEFVKSLKDLKIIERKGNTYHMTRRVQDVTIPSTIQDVIMARVDSMPQEAKEVLQTGAVVDREFSYELIKRVTDLPEQALLSCLSGLRDSELLFERGIYPKSTYIFKHALTQEVAYNGLLSKRRKRIHEKIGSAIEELYSERLDEYSELLAYHYVRSANQGKAVEYLNLANQKAARTSALEEAKGYFDQAMELLDTLPDTDENRIRRISLLTNQWVVFVYLFKVQEYYDLLTRYEPLVTKVDSPGLQGAFYARLGACEGQLGSLDQSIQTETKAAELCEAAGNAEDAAFAYVYLQLNYLIRGEFDRVLALKEDVLRKMDQRFNINWYVVALSRASVAYSAMGRWDEAVGEGQKALKVAQEFSDNHLVSMAAYNISNAYYSKGDLDRALEYGELAVAKAPTPVDKAMAEAYLARAWCRAGELEKGIDVLSEVVQLARAARLVPSELVSLIYLCEGYFLAEDHDKARQTGEELLEFAERCGIRSGMGYAHYILGEVALETDPAQAVPHFEKSISIFQGMKAEPLLASAYAGYGRLHRQQGDTEQAREYLTKALEIFNRLGTLIEPDKVRKELAELPQ
jgi:tetratricopeptide (TPR) repeat protein